MPFKLVYKIVIVLLFIVFGQAYAQKSDSIKLKISQVELGYSDKFYGITRTGFNNIYLGVAFDYKPNTFKKERQIKFALDRYKSFDYFSSYKRYSRPNLSKQIAHGFYISANFNLIKKTSFFALRIGPELQYYRIEENSGEYNYNSFLDIRTFTGLGAIVNGEIFSKNLFSLSLETSLAFGLGHEYGLRYVGSTFLYEYSGYHFRFFTSKLFMLSLKYNFK